MIYLETDLARLAGGLEAYTEEREGSRRTPRFDVVKRPSGELQ